MMKSRCFFYNPYLEKGRTQRNVQALIHAGVPMDQGRNPRMTAVMMTAGLTAFDGDLHAVLTEAGFGVAQDVIVVEAIPEGRSQRVERRLRRQRQEVLTFGVIGAVFFVGGWMLLRRPRRYLRAS